MSEVSMIELFGEKYQVLEELPYLTIPDSFVKNNKIGKGHGEARLYVGSTNSEIDFNIFFEGFKNQCFLLKSDLLSFLIDSKYEYYHKEQLYQRDITPFWGKINDAVSSFQEELLCFNIDSQNGEKDENRFYVSSSSRIYSLMREISLPNITYLTIYKLKNIASGAIMFYFYLFLDYTYNSKNHPQLIDKIEKRLEKKLEGKDISKKEKLKITQIVKSRIGQGDYRIRLLQDMNCCIVTGVNDERLLIASHIKPRAIAEDSEKIDYLNGLILTPTYDRLFDQGFITFTNNGEMLVSPYISPMNQKKLNLVNGKKFNLNSKGRELYLQYHREKIYKGGNIN